MNAWPIRRRFSCGSVTPGQRLEERRLGVHDPQLGVGPQAERLDDRRPLVLAQQPGVHEHADHPGAQRPGQECGADGRIHAARESADDPLGRPDPAGDLRHRPPDELRPSSRPAGCRRSGRGSCPGSASHTACARPRGGTGARRTAVERCRTAAIGQLGVAARGMKSPPASWIWSPWLIQTIVSRGTSWKIGSWASSTRHSVRPYSPRAGLAWTRAPRASAASCNP